MSVRAVYGLTGGICCLALLIFWLRLIYILLELSASVFTFYVLVFIGLLLAVYGCLGENPDVLV